MTRLRLAHTVLLCGDLERAVGFYREVLGLAVAAELPGWIELDAGAGRLTLRRRDRPYDGGGPSGAAVQIAFLVAAEAEVDDWHERLAEAGVDVVEPPATTDYGHRTLFFRDPDGNVLEIYAEV
jgi:catechol 2,3-dioxygenase-like lactoylglutathione lyase family enzyme